MKKLSVLVPSDRTDELMKHLQRLRCTRIERLPDCEEVPDADKPDAALPSSPTDSAVPVDAVSLAVSDAADESGAPDEEGLPDFVLPEVIASAGTLDEIDLSERSGDLARRMNDLDAAIAILDAAHTAKIPLFRTPETLSPDAFDGERRTKAEEAVAEAKRIRESSEEAKRRSVTLRADIEALAPFENVRFDLPRSYTVSCITVSGTLPVSADIEAIEYALSPYACVFDVVSDTKTARGVCLTALRGDFEECLTVLSSSGFSQTTAAAAEKDGFAAGKIKRLRDELKKCADIIDKEKSAAEALSNGMLGELKTYRDVLASEQARCGESAKLRVTGTCNVLGAFVPEKSVEKVAAVLDSVGAAYEFTDPEPERESVPIKLENGRLASQFEPILGMYSFPAYGGFDPTLPMAVFYIVIFGMMFADVGYGLLLALGCLAGLKLLHPTGTMKKMITMFAICGCSSAVQGVIFGGYFGDLPTRIMTDFFGIADPPKLALAFDMVADPMSFIVVALVLGALHLLFGMALKFYVMCRAGHPIAAIFDVGSWFILFAGLGLYFVFPDIALPVIILGVVMLVVSQGREAKNPIVRLGKGVLSLYDLISYGSDLLSYARIVALGLASAVIANVVNIFGTMGGPGIGGVISLILAFLIGHTLNFAINVLGTYVHTSRLQYIEFFGKFYESGGREFVPLAPEEKYVRFSDEK